MKTRSRPEALILAGVALIVLSILLPSLWAIRIHGRIRAVREDLLGLADALARFQVEYGVWPTRRACGYGDCRFGDGIPNREVMNALRAVDGPGNEQNAVNPNRYVFLSPPSRAGGASGLDGDGEYRDPWGKPYQVLLDTDLNGECKAESTIRSATTGGGVLVWSCGPDRKSDTADDVFPVGR